MNSRKLPPHLIKRARHLRKESTHCERLLWRYLRRRQLNGYRFRRQHILPPYIVDFYCHSERLVVELDGEAHDGLGNLLYDRRREQILMSQYDVKILRFTNQQVNEQLEGVLFEIAKKLEGI